MTVFRGYLKVVRSNWPTICLYLGIFIACTILFQFTAQSTDEETYQMSGMNIGVTDGDGGELAGALIAYLGSIHHVTELEDEISVLQEKLYYRDVDYILRIPDDFYEECVSGGKKLEVTSIPGSYSGIYVEQQIGSFLNNAAVYQEAGFTETEAARALEQREAVRVELADYGNSSADEAGYSYYFRYMPYLYLAVFGFVLGDILWIFGRKDLNRRMMASPVPVRRQKLEGMLCMALFGGAVWIILTTGAAVYYGSAWLRSSNLEYYILNTLALLISSLALSFLVGTVSPNRDALTGIVNILSLGVCFLGGAFVTLDALNVKLKNVSRFLPVYWYERANDILTDFPVLTENARTEVLEAAGIQIVFAAAFFCAALAAAKYKQTER